MSSSWLNNKKVQVSLVDVDGNSYLVYCTLVGWIIPMLVEEVDTGKRIKFDDIRNEFNPINNDFSLDNTVRLMIQKLQELN